MAKVFYFAKIRKLSDKLSNYFYKVKQIINVYLPTNQVIHPQIIK